MQKMTIGSALMEKGEPMKLIDADEAFRVLSDYYHHRTETQADALREALDRVPEVVVDKNTTEYIVRETSYPLATKQEVIGELVRCRDCIYWEPATLSSGNCGRALEITAYKDDYCSYGERNAAESG